MVDDKMFLRRQEDPTVLYAKILSLRHGGKYKVSLEHGWYKRFLHAGSFCTIDDVLFLFRCVLQNYIVKMSYLHTAKYLSK